MSVKLTLEPLVGELNHPVHGTLKIEHPRLKIMAESDGLQELFGNRRRHLGFVETSACKIAWIDPIVEGDIFPEAKKALEEQVAKLWQELRQPKTETTVSTPVPPAPGAEPVVVESHGPPPPLEMEDDDEFELE